MTHAHNNLWWQRKTTEMWLISTSFIEVPSNFCNFHLDEKYLVPTVPIPRKLDREARWPCMWCALTSVFQIKSVLPSEMDKNAFGRENNGSSSSCRTGLFPATIGFLKFSNRTIIKGDVATFVKQCQNRLYPFFETISFLYIFAWPLFARVDNFRR